MKHKDRKSYSRSYSRSHSRSRTKSRSRSRSVSRDRYKSSRRHDKRSRSREYRAPAKIDPTRINPTPSNVLGVFGLNPHITENHLSNVFSKYGKLTNTKLILDGKSGRSRGFGFVYFDREEDAIKAKEALHGFELEGNKIRVDYSITQNAHAPTPGIYMGYTQAHGSSYHRNNNYRRSPHRSSYSRRSPRYSRPYRSRSRSYERRHRRGQSPYYR